MTSEEAKAMVSDFAPWQVVLPDFGEQRAPGPGNREVNTMWMRSLKMAAAALLLPLAASVSDTAEKGQPIPPLKPEQFAELHRLIKPQPGELRFHEIPWLIDVWQA